MRMRFTKMHGLGNDFVIVRAGDREPPDGTAIRALADRRTGIGFDQLLWLEKPRSSDADVYYRVFNSDGGEVEQCGNGARCIARLIGDEAGNRTVVLEHRGGTSEAELKPNGLVAVNMGVPTFRPEDVPFIADEERPSYPIEVDGERIEIGVVSVGNPHAVLEVTDVAEAPVDRLGARLEGHERFPNRANIGFMQVVDPGHILLRVFERGVGETRACGTGACAAVVVGRDADRLSDDVTVELPGGNLDVRWQGRGSPVWLIGETVAVYEGAVDA